jgi:hypothetical protein
MEVWMLALAILSGLATVAGSVVVVLSRWPVGDEVKAVCELIDHDVDDWEWKDQIFHNVKATIFVRSWKHWDNERRIEVKGSITRKWVDITWAERRTLRAAMRRWERKRIQGVVIKALED